MADEQPAYRFTGPYVDLKDYLRGRRMIAVNLRRDAEMRMRRAEQIEEEAAAIEDALVPVEPAPPQAEAGP